MHAARKTSVIGTATAMAVTCEVFGGSPHRIRITVASAGLPDPSRSVGRTVTVLGVSVMVMVVVVCVFITVVVVSRVMTPVASVSARMRLVHQVITPALLGVSVHEKLLR